MKKCPKTLVATMVTAMIATMGSGAVLAEELDTKNVEVKYEVAQSYTWTIHNEITFDDKNDTVSNQKVNVSKNVIPEGKKLKITVAGSGEQGKFTILHNGGKKKLSYEITKGDAEISPNGEVLSVDAGTNAGAADLTYKLTKDSVETAGTYVGAVTYTASIVPKDQQ